MTNDRRVSSSILKGTAMRTLPLDWYTRKLRFLTFFLTTSTMMFPTSIWCSRAFTLLLDQFVYFWAFWTGTSQEVCNGLAVFIKFTQSDTWVPLGCPHIPVRDTAELWVIRANFSGTLNPRKCRINQAHVKALTSGPCHSCCWRDAKKFSFEFILAVPREQRLTWAFEVLASIFILSELHYSSQFKDKKVLVLDGTQSYYPIAVVPLLFGLVLCSPSATMTCFPT